NTTTSNSTDIDGLAALGQGKWYATVTGRDIATNETATVCSTDFVTVDSVDPTWSGTVVASGDASSGSYDSDGSITLTWSAFTEVNLANQKIYSYTSAANCSTNTSGTEEKTVANNIVTTSVTGLSNGNTYYLKVLGTDSGGRTAFSGCSGGVTIDTARPSNAGTSFTFTDSFDNDGDNIRVSWIWPDSSDTINYQLHFFKDSSCATPIAGAVFNTSDTSKTNTTLVDNLDGLGGEGVWYAHVLARDNVGLSSPSTCSGVGENILIDTISPVDQTANLIFDDIFDGDGDDLNIRWKVFTDTNLDHYIVEIDSSLTDCQNANSTADYIFDPIALKDNAGNVIYDGNTSNVDIPIEGEFYGRVKGVDSAGNITTSACSTDTIKIDTTAPVHPTGAPVNISFAAEYSQTGASITVSWPTPFVESNPDHHRLYTYTDQNCSLNESAAGSTTGPGASTDNATLTGLSEDEYWLKVRVYDKAGHYGESNCSQISAVGNKSLKVDTTNPTDVAVGDIGFSPSASSTGDTITVDWTDGSDGFEDLYGLENHRVQLFTASNCGSGQVYDSGFPGTAITGTDHSVSGLAEGTYYASVTGRDPSQRTTTVCGTNSLLVDKTPPNAATPGVTFTFTDDWDANGDDIRVDWEGGFTETNLSTTTVYLYPNASCTNATEVIATPVANSPFNNSTDVDGISDGTFYGLVEATDTAGQSTKSACSTDSIIIDKTDPAVSAGDSSALEFTASLSSTGDNIPVQWDGFTETNLTGHSVTLYSDSSCATAVASPVSLSTSNSDNTNIDGLATGEYWGRVTATDLVGRTTTGACSQSSATGKSIIVDKEVPAHATPSVVEPTPTYSNLGSAVPVGWSAFTDNRAITNHRIFTYKHATCGANEKDHGLTGSTTNTNAALISSVDDGDGSYHVKVRAYDEAGHFADSVCSTTAVIIDRIDPTPSAPNNFEFIEPISASRDDLMAQWNVFTDVNLASYTVRLFSDTCTTLVGSPYTGISIANGYDLTNIDVAADGTYYGNVEAIDAVGNSTYSNCSVEPIIVDTVPPAPTGVPSTTFDSAYDNDGQDIGLSWTVIGDVNLKDHKIITYDDPACNNNPTFHGWTKKTTTDDAGIIDLNVDGVYYAQVTAIDKAGHMTSIACSSNTVTVDTKAPQDNTANLQFDDSIINVGDAVDVTWTAFTDPTLSDHHIYLYTNSDCTAGEYQVGSNGDTSNTFSGVPGSPLIGGLTYWGKVEAEDTFGRKTKSKCSTDSLLLNSEPILSNSTINSIVNATIYFKSSDITDAVTESDGDTITKIQIKVLPTSGILSVSGTPIVADDEILVEDYGNIRFAPPAGTPGSWTMDWNANDGSEYADSNAVMTFAVANEDEHNTYENGNPAGDTFVGG
ncbi:hypothetical protein OAB57_03525, partial [Bacteriovoracaceae bacterium]|nr:hypothetical protein [Bacteriovoracaceae bacterium]